MSNSVFTRIFACFYRPRKTKRVLAVLANVDEGMMSVVVSQLLRAIRAIGKGLLLPNARAIVCAC